MNRLVVTALVIFLLLNGCAKSNTPENDSLVLNNQEAIEIRVHTARLLGEEAMQIVEQYPKTKTFAGGFYYAADLNDDGIEEIYILPWGSGVPVIHRLDYYDPVTDTFDSYDDGGKAYWYFIFKDGFYVGSPSDEYMMIYDNIESVYIPYLEDGELMLKRADESLEEEILGSDLEALIPFFGQFDE